MFCTKCGKMIADDSKFCGYCGAVNNEAPSVINNAAGVPFANNPVPAPAPKVKKPRKKIKINLKKLVAVVLVIALLGGIIGFAVTYETSEKALENIIEGVLSGEDEVLDKYDSALVVLRAFKFSKEVEKNYEEAYEGNVAGTVEYYMMNDFTNYFGDDDYDISWEIISKTDVNLDDEEYNNLDVMKEMLDKGFISSVFHPQLLIDAVEYEVEFTAQELNEKRTTTVKFLLVNYNMKWYLTRCYTVYED